MCDQTEIPYNPGDIVWVKLGPVWWPGQVQDYDKLPEEITTNFKKKPIAVVKFFQEESFEYVKNINHVYHYNCRRKNEFIKKGLDMCRSSNTRDVPSNMNLFPNDIATAEHLTGGNPNIIKDDEFAPEEKPNYSDLFGTKKTPGKKLKSDLIKKEYGGWRLKNIKEASLKNCRRSLPITSPRAITHPRFINKAFHGESDHEIRIRHQVTTPLREDDPVSLSPIKQYNCHICGFTSSRLNVIILHNKSHSAGFADTYLATSASQLKRPKLKDYSVPPAVVKSRVKSTPRRLLLGLDSAKRKKERFSKETKLEISDEGPVTSTPKKEKVVEDIASIKKPEFGKRKSTKDKKQNTIKQKLDNEGIRETLLKDWDEDDEMQEEAEIEQIKQIKEGKSDEDKEEKPEVVKVGQSRLLGKRSLRLGKPLDNKEDLSKGKETSCFDFDDSDEGIRLDGTVMKFGMKIPRVLGDDKTKRKSVDIETVEQIGSEKDDDNKEKKLEDIKKAEEDKKLEIAFESLLEETAVPIIPDVQKNLPAINTLDCIKSVSTDIQGINNSTDIGLDILNVDETNEFDKSKVDATEITCQNKLKTEIDIEIEDNVQESNILSDSSVLNETLENDFVEVLSETTVESSPICNITEVASINAKDFEDLNEFESKVDSDNPLPCIASDTETTVTASESILDSTVIKPEQDIHDVEVTSSNNTNMEVERVKLESNKIVQQNESEEFVEFSVPGNSVEISDSMDKSRDNLSDKNMFVKEETINDHHSENSVKKDIDKHIEVFTMEHDGQDLNGDKELLQKTNEISGLKNIFVQSNLETHSKEEDKQTFTDYKMEPNSESENIQNNVPSSPVEAKLDLQHIVNDIYVEETISQHGICKKNNVEITSDPTLLPESLKSSSILEQDIKKEIELKTETNEPILQNVNVPENDKFQDVPFDINSMPVIIGEDLIHTEETKTSIILNPNKTSDLTQSENKNVIMISNQGSSGQNEVVSGSNVLQSVISVAGKDAQLITGKSIGQKPLTTVKTIKIPPGSSLNKLKSVPGYSKSGSNQVLILKAAGGQSSKIAVNKSSLQKLGTQQIIHQSGGKVLILTNPQTSGQGKITTLTSQQQVLTSSGKIPPGTRLITSKGTVLSTSGAQTVTLGKSTMQKAGGKTGQKYVISKGNILTTTSKNMMIGKSGILTPITSTTTKGQTFITQNVVTNKGSLIVPSSSTISKSPSIMTQAITSKGMILTPMTSKGIISGNQKVRIVTSTAPMTLPTGARFVVQNPQSKLVTIPQQKNQKLKIVSNTKRQPSGSTLLIQTSQDYPAILTSTISTNHITTKPKLIQVGKTLPVITPQIVPRLTVPQTQPQILTKKIGAQKVRQVSPNILQKSQKKLTSRGQKNFPNRLISPQTAPSPAQETILLSPTGLPVVDQSSIIKAGLPQSDTALVYLTVDESGNYRPLENSLVSFEGTQEDSRTLYIDPGTTDMDNIFLTIDDAGNVVNISQPAPPTFTSESSIPSQDILAKALANTQVLQQETIIPDMVTSSIVSSSLDHSSTGLNSSFTEQAHYPAPSLSHSVLETSLTLNQPIMTPLEVPSAVSSSNLSQITSLPSSFIHSNLLTNPKTQLIRPSMPLLTEDSDSSRQPEPVYLLDSAHNIIAPVTSGSQLSLQLTLNDNVIVSSQGGGSLIPSTYQVVTSNMFTSPVFTDQNTTFKTENDEVRSLNDTNSVVQTPFIIQSDQNEITIPADYNNQENQSESPHITTDFLNDVESKPIESDIKTETVSDDKLDRLSNKTNVNEENTNHYLNDEIDKPLLKRSIDGGCDMKLEIKKSPKRIKIEER